MADSQEKITKAHDQTHAALGKLMDNETHRSFSLELITFEEVFSELDVFICTCALTTLRYHRDSGVQGSEIKRVSEEVANGHESQCLVFLWCS